MPYSYVKSHNIWLIIIVDNSKVMFTNFVICESSNHVRCVRFYVTRDIFIKMPLSVFNPSHFSQHRFVTKVLVPKINHISFMVISSLRHNRVRIMNCQITRGRKYTVQAFAWFPRYHFVSGFFGPSPLMSILPILSCLWSPLLCVLF